MATNPPPVIHVCRKCNQAPAIWAVVLQYLAVGAPDNSTSPVEVQYPVPLCEGCARLDAGDAPYMSDEVFAQLTNAFAAINFAQPDRKRCTVVRKPWMQSLPANMPPAA